MEIIRNTETNQQREAREMPGRLVSVVVKAEALRNELKQIKAVRTQSVSFTGLLQERIREIETELTEGPHRG